MINRADNSELNRHGAEKLALGDCSGSWICLGRYVLRRGPRAIKALHYVVGRKKRKWNYLWKGIEACDLCFYFISKAETKHEENYHRILLIPSGQIYKFNYRQRRQTNWRRSGIWTFSSSKKTTYEQHPAWLPSDSSHLLRSSFSPSSEF